MSSTRKGPKRELNVAEDLKVRRRSCLGSSALQCARDESLEVRQSTFAVMGELAKSCMSTLRPALPEASVDEMGQSGGESMRFSWYETAFCPYKKPGGRASLSCLGLDVMAV